MLTLESKSAIPMFLAAGDRRFGLIGAALLGVENLTRCEHARTTPVVPRDLKLRAERPAWNAIKLVSLRERWKEKAE